MHEIIEAILPFNLVNEGLKSIKERVNDEKESKSLLSVNIFIVSRLFELTRTQRSRVWFCVVPFSKSSSASSASLTLLNSEKKKKNWWAVRGENNSSSRTYRRGPFCSRWGRKGFRSTPCQLIPFPLEITEDNHDFDAISAQNFKVNTILWARNVYRNLCNISREIFKLKIVFRIL